MPYHIEWLIPNQLLYTYNYGHMTVAETEDVLEQLFTMTMSPESIAIGLLVHVISDTSHVIQNDMGIQDYRRIFGDRKHEATHPGWTMTISTSAMERFMGSIALQFLGIRGRQVANIDDAINFLATSDETLPPADEIFKLYEVTDARIKSQITQ